MARTRTILNESSLSRLWQHIQSHECAIISASRDQMVNCRVPDASGRGSGNGGVSKGDNARATRDMKAALLARGYGVTRVDGSYIENYNTDAAKEVKETSFFVVNLINDSGFNEEIAALGESFCQDAVILIPKGGRGSYLLGTNDAGFPGYQQTIDLGDFKGGREAEFMTRVGGRSFVLESYEDLPRLQRMAVRAINRNNDLATVVFGRNRR